MTEQFARTALLLGESAVERLAGCRVAVFGVGGVGGFCVEALARSGVGALDLIDNDTVALSQHPRAEEGRCRRRARAGHQSQLPGADLARLLPARDPG